MRGLCSDERCDSFARRRSSTVNRDASECASRVRPSRAWKAWILREEGLIKWMHHRDSYVDAAFRGNP